MVNIVANPDNLAKAFARRFPLDSDGHRLLRELGPKICLDHFRKRLADSNTESRLCSQNNETYWQQLSEVLVAAQLAKVGLDPMHKNTGPDFMIEYNQKRIWIEVICPTPAGVPEEWLHPPVGKVYPYPHEALLLRWASAIKEKAEKLIGKSGKPLSGYLQKRCVAEDDVYVIAINGRLLRAAFPQIQGISQWPCAVEATLCVGPYALTLDTKTSQVVDRGHQHRPFIPKPNGAAVPSCIFLDPKFNPISAIWAMDFDECLILGHQQLTAVIHNPLACNPLIRNILPAMEEYYTIDEGTHYRLERACGRLPIGKSKDLA